MNAKSSEFVIKDNKLYEYLGNGEKIIIPEGVESVEIDDFRKSVQDIKRFKKVVIPGTLKEIPDRFLRDKVIDKLEIQEGVERIGWSAFHTTPMKSLKLPSTIKEIDSYAFYNCGLKKISLNPAIERLCNYCFSKNNFSRFIYPKGAGCLDLDVIFPISYLQSKIEIIFDSILLNRNFHFPNEITSTSMELSIIVSNRANFSLNSMYMFFEKMKKNGYHHAIQKITLFGYHNPIYLALLREKVKSMGMNIEIEMIKEINEDLFVKVTEEKEKYQEEKEVLQSTNTGTNKEIETLVQEIKEKSHILEESLREEILSRVNDLIQAYQKNLMELKPRFESENEISLGVCQDPQSLSLDLISKLQRMNTNFINLDANIYLKKKIEQYKELVNDDSTIENLEQAESIEDKIQCIKNYALLMNQDNIKDEILKILTEIESHILIPSLDIITLSMEQSSIDYKQELERKVDWLYQKVKENYQFYQSLCGENDTSLGNDMKLLNEIINSLDEKSKKDYQERIKKIKVKYLIEVKKLKIEMDSELKIREDLAPILKDLKELIPNMKGKKSILDDINEARKVITRRKDQQLDDMINELSSTLFKMQFEDSTLNDVFKWRVKELIQRLSDMDSNSTLEEEKKKELALIVTDIQNLIRRNLDLLKGNMTGKNSGDSISNRVANIISDYYNGNNILLPVEIDEKKARAITSTVRDILSSLENPIFDEVVKNQIETSLTQILNDSYQEIISGSFVIEEREDSVTKNLDWSSRATLQVLSEFHKIENFIDETIKYNEEIESFNTNHGKGA